MSWAYWLILFFAVVLVHGVKMLRLYTVLFGKNISIGRNIALYCLSVPFSILLPYKIGELVKLFVYGRALKSFSSALIAILIDRFFDTIVLIFAISIMSAVLKISLPFVIVLLSAFLLVLIALYFVLPGICAFWKSLFLRSYASRRHNAALKVLDNVEKSCKQVKGFLRGRASVLFVLSLFAWGLELFSVGVLSLFSGKNIWNAVFEYLDSALLSTSAIWKNLFLVVSVAALLFAFLILKIREFLKNRRENERQ